VAARAELEASIQEERAGAASAAEAAALALEESKREAAAAAAKAEDDLASALSKHMAAAKAAGEQETRLIEALRRSEEAKAAQAACHSAALQSKDREVKVLKCQLGEAEGGMEALEAKLRKVTREKQFLAQELTDQAANGGSGELSAAGAAELKALQKEYRELSARYARLQESALAAPPSALSQEAPSRHAPVRHLEYSSIGRQTRQSAQNTLGDAVAVYERKMSKLDDEKRELVMKCTAAVSDRESALAESRRLSAELASCKERATALELEKERAVRRFQAASSRNRTPATVKGPPLLEASNGKENAPVNSREKVVEASPTEQCNQS